jgi:hypothetical protein
MSRLKTHWQDGRHLQRCHKAIAKRKGATNKEMTSTQWTLILLSVSIAAIAIALVLSNQ